MVNRMANYSVFSTFDLKHAYHQVEISPKDRIYITFGANGSLYEFKSNSMSVTNGVLKFQCAVDKVVEVEGLEGTFPYKDNVTVCGINQNDHDEDVSRSSDAAKKYNLTLNESQPVSSATSLTFWNIV